MIRILILLLLAVPLRAQEILAPFLLTGPDGAPPVTFGVEAVISTTGSASSVTQSFTITDADLIVVCTSTVWTSVSGVTYNGVALTEQTSREYSGFGSFIHTLANPATGAHNVVVTLAGASDATVTIISVKKTHNTTPVSGPVEAEGTSTSPSVSVSSATGALVIDCLCWYQETATATAGGGQTQRSNQTVGDCGGAVSTKAGAASVSMGWTISASREWAHTAISVNPE
jgi:hypothetical protein